jgi:hypothetical protein
MNIQVHRIRLQIGIIHSMCTRTVDIANIMTSSVSSKIGIVRRRCKRHRARGTLIEVAESICLRIG